MLLYAHQLGVADFNGQIATGNHHGIGCFDYRVQGFDIVGKLTQPEAVVEGTAELGFPIDQTYIMGTVLLICLVVFAIPRTAVLGAVGLTAYLGGAVTANMRIEAPLLDHTLFAVYFGILLWVGLILRRPELLKVAGIRR